MIGRKIVGEIEKDIERERERERDKQRHKERITKIKKNSETTGLLIIVNEFILLIHLAVVTYGAANTRWFSRLRAGTCGRCRGILNGLVPNLS